MKRKIFKELCRWKESESRKPLVLLGARQVGKTWIMKDFGRQEYERVAYVNCDEEPRMKDLLALDYDLDRILLGLQAITGVKIEAGNTLVILDEIQEIPRGLHCLKYFYENAPQYHVMVAGSLLGGTLGRGENFPVGQVDLLHMYPMSFCEFLDAVGDESWNELLRSGDTRLIHGMGPKFIDLRYEITKKV